jgi:hypothetical protein
MKPPRVSSRGGLVLPSAKFTLEPGLAPNVDFQM